MSIGRGISAALMLSRGDGGGQGETDGEVWRLRNVVVSSGGFKNTSHMPLSYGRQKN